MRYLIVEGVTDVALIKYISLKQGITQKFNDFKQEKEIYRYKDLFIINLAGQGNLKKFLKESLSSTIHKINKVGIIQDSDDDFKDSLNDVRKAIENAELKKELEDKKIEIFLTPNNQDRGDLETLLISTIEDNSIFECFDQYSECLQKDNEIYPKAINKGKVHAYTMYSQKGENLYKPMQSFIHKDEDTSLWNIEHPNFKPIIDFVVKVFD